MSNLTRYRLPVVISEAATADEFILILEQYRQAGFDNIWATRSCASRVAARIDIDAADVEWLRDAGPRIGTVFGVPVA